MLFQPVNGKIILTSNIKGECAMKGIKKMVMAAGIISICFTGGQAVAANTPDNGPGNCLSAYQLDIGNILLARGGNGPGDGTGNGGEGPGDGTGNGPGTGDCLNINQNDMGSMQIARGGNGNGNGRRGPGDGTGNGGNGPKDGSGNGNRTGDCSVAS
jgi:hypothetical protein